MTQEEKEYWWNDNNENYYAQEEWSRKHGYPEEDCNEIESEDE